MTGTVTRRRHSPAVYRRRRLVVLLGLLAVIGLVVWLVVAPPWRGSAADGPAPVASSTPTGDPVATDLPALESDGSAATPTPGPSDATAAPDADAAAGEGDAPAAPSAEPCVPGDLLVEAVTDKTEYAAGENPQLLARGADVLQVNYNYIDAFRGLDSAEQHRWLAADSDAAYRTFIALHSYTHLTVVGKSLGTLAMAHLFATHDFSTPPTALWLTPVLTNAAVREQITAFAGPSLIVIGTADSFYDPGLLAAIGETPTRRFAIIEGADHGMNVNDDVFQSLQALEQALRAVEVFLNH